MAKERVLIIDDAVESNQLIVDRVLTPHGFQALVALDGETGLNLAIAEQPDLILLAVNTPKKNGIDVLTALKKQNLEIPAIIMTSDASEPLTFQALRLGIKDYILKPFRPLDMVVIIERVLSERHLRQERDELAKRLMFSEQQLQRHQTELNTLFGIGKSVTAVVEPQKLLASLIEAAVYLTNAEDGLLLLIDEQTNELYVAAARGIEPQLAETLRFSIDDSLVGEVVTTGQPLRLAKVDRASLKIPYSVYALLYVPLAIQGNVMGVLCVHNREQTQDFGNHDLRLLSMLADYTAVFWQSIQLFQRLENEHNKFMTIASGIEEPIVILSYHDDTIIAVNRAFRNILGLGKAKVDNKPLAEVFQIQSLAEFLETASAVESYRGEISLEEGHTFSVNLVPIPEVGRALFMRDITPFKAMEQVKSDFVSTLSRYLQSPLISIKDYADMLETVGPLTRKQQLFANRIKSSIDKLTVIVDELLELSAIESEPEFDSAALDLSKLAADVVSEFQEEVSRKQQQLVYHAPAHSAYVRGSLLQLKRVISNLLDNAVKYTLENGHISIIIRVDRKQLLLKVEDSGLGIPSADLPFVFNKFFRVTHEDRKDVQGAGLGLAFCKSIIEKYGGSISVESEHRRGSTFTIALPPVAADKIADTANAPLLNAEVIQA